MLCRISWERVRHWNKIATLGEASWPPDLSIRADQFLLLVIFGLVIHLRLKSNLSARFSRLLPAYQVMLLIIFGLVIY